MPAAIPKAKRPDESPCKTIQTTIISKITDTAAVNNAPQSEPAGQDQLASAQQAPPLVRAERSRPVRRSFAELLSAKLVKLENDFGLEPEFGLHVIAGQVAISLKSARAAFGHAADDDAPPLNVRQGAVPPRLQEAEAMRLQRTFGIDREYALRLLRERAIGRRSASAGRQVSTRTHRRLPVDYSCLEVQDAVEAQSEEPGPPTRASELLARSGQNWALRTAWSSWCRWAAAKAKTAAAPHRRPQCSNLRSNRVATSFKAWRARISLTAEARRLTSDSRCGKRAMRWAWQHLVRCSVSRGLRIVPLQVAWRIWRTTAVAEATKAGRRRRCQMYVALRAWQQRTARTKAVRDRTLPLKLASPRTAFGAERNQARWLLLRRAWARWMLPSVRSASAEATLAKHLINESKVSKLRLAWSVWLRLQVRFAEDPLARGTHIFVKGLTSRQLQLFTSLSTTAAVVSQALAQRLNGPAPMLKWGGHYLNGPRQLSSYHLRSGDTIEASLGLRGGMDGDESKQSGNTPPSPSEGSTVEARLPPGVGVLDVDGTQYAYYKDYITVAWKTPGGEVCQSLLEFTGASRRPNRTKREARIRKWVQTMKLTKRELERHARKPDGTQAEPPDPDTDTPCQAPELGSFPMKGDIEEHRGRAAVARAARNKDLEPAQLPPVVLGPEVPIDMIEASQARRAARRAAKVAQQLAGRMMGRLRHTNSGTVTSVEAQGTTQGSNTLASDDAAFDARHPTGTGGVITQQELRAGKSQKVAVYLGDRRITLVLGPADRPEDMAAEVCRLLNIEDAEQERGIAEEIQARLRGPPDPNTRARDATAALEDDGAQIRELAGLTQVEGKEIVRKVRIVTGGSADANFSRTAMIATAHVAASAPEGPEILDRHAHTRPIVAVPVKSKISGGIRLALLTPEHLASLGSRRKAPNSYHGEMRLPKEIEVDPKSWREAFRVAGAERQEEYLRPNLTANARSNLQEEYAAANAPGPNLYTLITGTLNIIGDTQEDGDAASSSTPHRQQLVHPKHTPRTSPVSSNTHLLRVELESDSESSVYSESDTEDEDGEVANSGTGQTVALGHLVKLETVYGGLTMNEKGNFGRLGAHEHQARRGLANAASILDAAAHVRSEVCNLPTATSCLAVDPSEALRRPLREADVGSREADHHSYGVVSELFGRSAWADLAMIMACNPAQLQANHVSVLIMITHAHSARTRSELHDVELVHNLKLNCGISLNTRHELFRVKRLLDAKAAA